MAQRGGGSRGPQFNLKRTSASSVISAGPQQVFRPPQAANQVPRPVTIDLTENPEVGEKTKRNASSKRAWMDDVPPPSTKQTATVSRGAVQESNKRRKLFDVDDDENDGAHANIETGDRFEAPASPQPTQVPVDTPQVDINGSIDISVMDEDGIPASASQGDGILLSESPSQAVANAAPSGRVFWAPSSTTVSVLRPGGGIQDLTSTLHSESPNGTDVPNPLFSEWFAPVSGASAASDNDSGHSREGAISDEASAPPPSRLLGILERLSSTSKPNQVDASSVIPLSDQRSASIAPAKSVPHPASLSPPPPKMQIQTAQHSNFAAVSPPAKRNPSQESKSVQIQAPVPLTHGGSSVVRASSGPAPLSQRPISVAADVEALFADLPSDVFSDFSYSPPKPTSVAPVSESPAGEGKYRRLQILEKLSRPEENKSIWRCLDELDPRYPEWEVEVSDPWRESDVAVGDFINVVGKPEPASGCPETRRFVVDDDKNLLVLQPDLLLPTTMVTTVCTRQAILKRLCKPFDRFRIYEAVRGDIIHRVIQEILKSGKRLSKEDMLPVLKQEISRQAEELDMMKKTPAEVEKDIATSALIAIQKVGASFFGPSFPSTVEDITFNGYKFKVRIQKCLEVEEKIESLVYGLKGAIDVSAEAVVHGNGLNMRTVELPLEIKSTYHPTHQRQVMAYSLLMADRYDRDIKGALVMGVGKDSTQPLLHGVTIDRPGVVELMRARNELASHMARGNLPPPIVGLSECEKCTVRDHCALFYKEDQLVSSRPYIPPADDKKLIESLELRSASLTQPYAEFMHHWIHLINIEERHTIKDRRSLWAMPPEERERRGLGFHNLRAKHVGTGGEHLYEFKRNHFGGSSSSSSHVPLFDSAIHENDEVVVSSGRHISLGHGRVVQTDPHKIVVLLKEKLISPVATSDDPTSQRFYGMNKPDRTFQSPVKPKIKPSYAAIPGPRNLVQDIEDIGSQVLIDRSDIEEQVWCIDKEDSLSTHATARSNILFMFLHNNAAATRLRRLIVDLDAPKFKKSPTPNSSFASGEVLLQDPLNGQAEAMLNEDQKRVINAVLEAQDYALILGMPGTGKTSAVAHLVSELRRQKKSILITAYTHSAVDNLLLKLQALGIEFCRLGDGRRVHEAIRQHVYSAITGANQPTQFDVVATTCWGIENLMLDKRTFDYCLVDEASQLTLPACIGPLRFAEKFVLIGDLYQLPPLVRNRDAKSDGLADSLFKKLSEAHPNAVFELRMQYRMSSDIMSLSNRLIYSGKLRCGNEEIKHAKLHLPTGLQSIPNPVRNDYRHWLYDLLDPSAIVRFVDTDALPAPEDVSGHSDSDATTRNDVEALIVSLLVKAALDFNIPPHHIGVIAHLRSQLRAISSRLGAKATSVEINTVDKYQGRDKEFVILSLVRNNPNGNIGTLMQDFRRLNVALTRAKHKLLIVGSGSTFRGHHLFSELLDHLSQRSWIYKLPPAAHTFYDHKIT